MSWSSLLFVILNAIAYTLLFVSFIRHQKGQACASFCLAIWAICAVGAIIYEPINFFGHIEPITFAPYLFLFLGYIILVYPVLKYHDNQILSFDVNKKKFIAVVIALGIISIPPFFESILYYAKTGGNSSLMLESFNERYADADTIYHYLSDLSKRCTYILHGTRLFSLFSLFYWPLIKCRHHRLIFVGICITNLMIFVEAIVLLARFQIVAYGLIGLFAFLLIRPLYSDELKQKITKTLKIAGTVVLVVIIAQTTLRLQNFQDQTKGMGNVSHLAYTLQYLSEGMGNFNGNLYYSEYRIGYDPVLKFYFNFFGIDLPESSGAFEKRFFLNQFFTIIGDYWRDYGAIGTIIALLLYSILMHRILQSSLRKYPMAKILIFLMYIKMVLMGPFYNAYYIDCNQLLYTPLFIVFFSLSFAPKRG